MGKKSQQKAICQDDVGRLCGAVRVGSKKQTDGSGDPSYVGSSISRLLAEHAVSTAAVVVDAAGFGGKAGLAEESAARAEDERVLGAPAAATVPVEVLTAEV